MSPRLVLIGPPGAGKTTVGSLVASRLAIDFRDTDADIETETGVSIAETFVDHGASHFRDLERAAVQRAIADADGVLALGSGAILEPASRDQLAGLPVVFLDLDLTDAVRRVGLARDRPASLGNPRAQLKILLDARRPLYQSVAVATVDTSGRDPTEVAADVLAALAEMQAR